jgi:DNA-binding GntR family transcriptional regulator
MSVHVDEYVIDTLMRDLVSHDKKPSAFVVYVYLWRRTLGQARPSVHQSHQQLADATGLSKSAVQSAVKILARRRLVDIRRANKTATPEYVVNRPWVR